MVQEALILQYAKKNNINVTDDEISKREDDLKANFPNGSWDEMLKARGLSEDDVKQALREQIILDKALAETRDHHAGSGARRTSIRITRRSTSPSRSRRATSW